MPLNSALHYFCYCPKIRPLEKRGKPSTTHKLCTVKNNFSWGLEKKPLDRFTIVSFLSKGK
jgi:hypothetical protein